MSCLPPSRELKLISRSHSDTTLSLLRRGGGVSAEEESVLAPWEWNHNEAFLHWDERVSYIGHSFWQHTSAHDAAHASQEKGIFRSAR